MHGLNMKTATRISDIASLIMSFPSVDRFSHLNEVQAYIHSF